MDLFDLAAKLSLNSSDFEKGLSSAKKSTSDFGQKLKTGIQTASKVAVAALAAVGTSAAVMTKKIVDGTKEVAAYGDTIDKASQKMGLSAQAYQEWDAILQHSGTSVDVLQRGMMTLTKAVESNDDAFKALGISQRELQGMNQEQTLAKVIEKLQGMEEGTQRTALAQKLLGGAAKELGPLLNTSAEDTEEMRKRLHELGGVMSDEAVKASAAYQDSLQDFQTALAGAKRGIISDFLPSVKGVMDGLTELFAGNSDSGLSMLNNGVKDFVSNLSSTLPKVLPMVGSVFSSLASAITDNIDTIADAAVGLGEQLVRAIINGAPRLINASVRIIKSLANSLKRNIRPLLKSVSSAAKEILKILADPKMLSEMVSIGAEMLESLAEGLLDALPMLVQEVPKIVSGFIDSLNSALPMLLDSASRIITTLIEGIAAELPNFLNSAADIVIKFVETLANNADKLVEAAGAIIDTLTTTVIPKLIETAPVIIKKLVTALIQNAPKLLSAGVELIKKLLEGVGTVLGSVANKGREIIDKMWNGIQSAWASVKDWGKKIVEKIKTGFVETLSEIRDIGKNIVEGVWQGIKNAAGWIKDKIKGFFSGLVNNVKETLGIASPSKVFAQIGGFAIEGFGKGFDEKFRSVSRDVKERMDELADQSVQLAADLTGDVGDSVEYIETDDGNGALVQILGKIDSTLDQILANIGFDIVLDDGTIAGRVDKLLGQAAMRKARGNA